MDTTKWLLVVALLPPLAYADDFDTLLDLLENGSPGERVQVVRVLGEYGGSEDVEHLIAALRDPAPDVRAAAATVLGTRRVAQAFRALERALADADPLVRKQAGWAMQRIQGAAGAGVAARRKRGRITVLSLRSDFEKGEPADAGWRMLVDGRAAASTAERAHAGRRSFRLEGGPDRPRCDYLALPRPYTRLTFEVAVYPDQTPGRHMRIGLLESVGRAVRFYNRFKIRTGEGGKGVVEFRGNLDRPPRKLADYEAGRWIVLRADLDLVRGQGDLFVDGECVAREVPLQPVSFAAGRRGRVSLRKWGVWTSKSGVLHVDDVRLLGSAPLSRAGPPVKPGKPDLAALLAQLAKGDARARGQAAQGLGRLGDPQAVPALIEALADSEQSVRLHVARAIASLKDARAVPALARRLDDEDPNVRQAVADALGSLGDARAVEPLLKAMADRRSPTRPAVIRALGKLRDERAIEPLFEILEGDDRAAGAEAATALAGYGAPVVPRLLDVLMKETRGCDMARRALHALGEPAIAPLVELLKSPAPAKRVAALGALADIRHERVDATLVSVLRDDADPRLRAQAARALANRKGAVEPLVAALRDSDRNVQCAAVEALGRRQDPRVVAALTAALRTDDAQMRLLVLSALCNHRGAAATDALLAALDDEQPAVRGIAIAGLGNQEDPRALDALLRLLKSDDPERRGAAASALGSAKGDHAPLLAALRDPDHGVRRRAAVALERRKWSPENQDDWIWFLVARGRFDEAGRRGAAAIEPLMLAVGSDDPSVVLEACRGLEAVGEAAIPRLLEVRTQSRDPWVLRGASRALQALGWKPGSDVERARLLVHAQSWDEVGAMGDAAIEPLVEALDCPDGEVRRQAARALDRTTWRPAGDAQAARYLVAARRWDDAVALGEPALGPLVAALASRGKFHGTARPAAAALGRLGDRRAVPPLIDLLTTGGREDCAAAAAALGRLGDARALEPLVAVLERPWDPMHEPDVTVAAAEALGDLGAKEAIPALRAVRARVRKTLEAPAEDPAAAMLQPRLRFLYSSLSAALVRLGDAE